MADGVSNRAALPVPSADPDDEAWPARVETTPSGEIRRIVALLESATSTLPELSTATACGPLNRAVAASPSALPQEPARPARVVTTPAGVTLRIAQFTWSATTRSPDASRAIPLGKANRAFAPVPSAVPRTPTRPAIVEADPSGAMRRMM